MSMARASHASGLAPPMSNYPPPNRTSSGFGPPEAMSNAPSRPLSRVEPPPLGVTAGPMPGTLERPINGPRKRLILTCDGTWLDATNGLINGKPRPPSNVSRIGWAIKETSRDGIPQIVNYQAGVGTTGTRLSRLVGGATGAGLKENVRAAYTYLCINWREGDEIFLLGFSRGAYTARSIGGMIGELGLLTRTGLPHFSDIFEDLEHRHTPHYVSKFPDSPFPNKEQFDGRYAAKLQSLGMTRMPVPIKAICCWDTVGSLGIPRTPWLEMFGVVSRESRDYEFYDTKLNPCVENAFQALAMDEHRKPFSPALWEKQSADRTNLKQVWFPGVHSNVGGGLADQELANITLAWMISRLEPFLDFRGDFLISLYEESRQYYKSTRQKPRPWSFGELYNSFKGLYAFTGSKARTPGNYYRTDPMTGNTTNKRLKNTNEYIHASVRTRLGLQGPGELEQGPYEPRALRDWTFEVEPSTPGQGGNADGNMVVWHNRSGAESGGQDRIPEAILLETELALLRQDPRTWEYIKSAKVPLREKRKSRRTGGDADGEDEGDGEGRPPGRRDADNAADGGDDERRRRRKSHGDGRDRDRDRDRDTEREKRRSRRYQDN